MSDSTTIVSKGGLLQWFSSNPIVGVVSFAMAVVSLAATVYFGLASFQTRKLSYYVNPSKSTIVKSGQSSGLHVLYNGQPVTSDVTALQLAIWNDGNQSIRPENVLSQVAIHIAPQRPILEASIRHVNRRISEIHLDDSRFSEGVVPLTWGILEHDDGAVVQLIVAAPDSVSASVQGVVEGQSAIMSVTGKGHQPKTAADYIVGYGIATVLLGVGVFFVKDGFGKGRFAKLWMVLFVCFWIAIVYGEVGDILFVKTIPLTFN